MSTNVQLVQPQWLVVFFCPVVMALIPNSLQEETKLSGLLGEIHHRPLGTTQAWQGLKAPGGN